MRSLALALLLTGCSWLTARSHNDPRVGCTRTPGRIDAGLAIAGGGMAAVAIVMRAIDPPAEGDHGNKGLETGLLVTTGLGVAIIELIQSSYGLRVADRCEADRARITGGPP